MINTEPARRARPGKETARGTCAQRIVVTMLLATSAVACGGEAEAPSSPVAATEPADQGSEPAPADPDVAAAAVLPPEPPAPELPAVPSEPVDLLRATGAAVAVSSAYRDDPAQVRALVDGDVETAWNSRTDDLVGAWIDLALPADATVTSMEITAGFTHRSASADLFEGNHRVSRVRVLREDVELGTFDLDPSSRALQPLPVSGAGGRYRIEIVEVTPGSRTEWREACISELRVLGRAPGAFAEAATPSVGIGTLPALSPRPTGPAPSPHDGMYFVLNGAGLVRLAADGGFRLTHQHAVDVARAPDGALHVLRSENGVQSVERLAGGGSSAPLAVDRALGWVGALAPQAGGQLWVAGAQGVGHHDGASWTITPRATFGGELRDVVVDPRGTVWVLTATGIYQRSASGTFERRTEEGQRFALGRMQIGPRGIVARASDGLVERSGDGFRPLTTPDGTRVDGAWAHRADGALAYSPGAGRLHVVPASGSPRTIDLVALGVPSSFVWSIAWDLEGRIWVATGVGLVVIDADLATLARWYQRGSVPALQREALQMLAIGGAPGLPEATPASGRVRGSVVYQGQPLAGVSVQICEAPYRGSWRGVTGFTSPCAEEYISGQFGTGTTTADDGTFRLWEVPRGTYYVAVARPDRSWWIARSSVCCARARRGEELDMGTIDVPPP